MRNSNPWRMATCLTRRAALSTNSLNAWLNWRPLSRLWRMKSFLRSVSVRAGLLLAAAVGVRAADTTFWIEPCSVMIGGCDAGDADLARWALEAWEKASGGKLHFVETKDRSSALLRVLWADKNSGL